MKKVLVFLEHYLPGHKSGGPLQTIKNIVDALGSEVEFSIVTLDRDVGETEPYSEIVVDEWRVVGHAKVLYLSPRNMTPRKIRFLIEERDYDTIYLNSFFSFRFSIVPMIVYNFIKPRASLLIAPRGEFSPGALNIKRWKKRAYIGFSKYLKLFRLATFHASTHMEKRDIEAVIGPGVTVHTAKDLPNLAMPDLRSFKNDMGQSKALKVCFISRLVPKKNLDYAIDILRTCRPPVEFTIFGSQEDPAYWSHCRQLLGALPSNVTWEYGGELLPSEVKDTFARFDVFLFPTRGENYGHVIAESLLSGTYVLVSDQTPWVGLEEAGVGCAIPLSRQREFASRISSWSSLSVEERYARKLEIQLKAKALVIDDQDVEDNLNLLGR